MTSPARSPSAAASQASSEPGGISSSATAPSTMAHPSSTPKLDHLRAERQRTYFRSSLSSSAKAIISGEWSKVSKKPYKPKEGIADPDHPKWKELVELQNKISQCSASRRNCKTAEATAEAEYDAKMTIRRAFPQIALDFAAPERPESMRSRAAPLEEDDDDEDEDDEEDEEEEEEENEEPDETEQPEEPEEAEEPLNVGVETATPLSLADHRPARAVPLQQLQATVHPGHETPNQLPQIRAVTIAPTQMARLMPRPALPHSQTARSMTAPVQHHDQSSLLEDEEDQVIILPPRGRRTRVKRERDPSYSPEPTPRITPGPPETKPKTTRNRLGDFSKRVKCADRVELGFLRKEIINKHELQLLQIERELAMLSKLPGTTVEGAFGGMDDRGCGVDGDGGD